jgi:hypothetical protein
MSSRLLVPSDSVVWALEIGIDGDQRQRADELQAATERAPA